MRNFARCERLTHDGRIQVAISGLRIPHKSLADGIIAEKCALAIAGSGAKCTTEVAPVTTTIVLRQTVAYDTITVRAYAYQSATSCQPSWM